jgi:predicted transcriptional regulator
LKDVLSEVFTHLGPKQLGALKDLIKDKRPEEIKEAANEEDEDVPNLVGKNFEQAGSQ